MKNAIGDKMENMRFSRTKTICVLLLILILLTLSSTAFSAQKKKKKTKKKKSKITAQINKAIPLYLRKNYKGAKKIFINVLKEKPNNVVARYYLAEIMFTDVRRYDDAKKQFEIVLKLKDKIKSDKFKIRNRYLFNNSQLKLGLVHLKSGQNFKAIKYLTKYLKNDKDSPARIMAYNSLAVAHSNLDDYENAIRNFQEALRLDKENLLARFNLSSINSKLIYYNTGLNLSIEGKHVEAAREFVKALDVDPFFVAAHFRLGMEHKYLRNLTDAENEFLRAIAINPDYVNNYRVYTQLADIMVNIDNLDGAKSYVAKALTIRPKHPQAFNVKGRISMKEADYPNAVSHFQSAINVRSIPEYEKNLKKAQDALLEQTKGK